MKNTFTLQRVTLLLTLSLLFNVTAIHAQLGQYAFTGVAVCPVTANAVTTQPTNAVFSTFSTLGTTCSPTANVFSSSVWNLTPTIDLAEYNEFTITPNACTRLDLTSISTIVKLSGTTNTATLILRSSLDGFASDITTLPITSVLSTPTLSLPTSFLNLTSAVTFRFYIVSITAATTTFRQDNVTLNGTATTNVLANYYIDADGDGFGNIATFINTCTPPLGYVANSTDCDDANSLVGSGITYYQDFDADTYGNPLVTLSACTPPVGYVANANDCNDNNALITVATLTFYADADLDGFGNPLVSTIACSAPVGYVSNATDCDDANVLIGVASTTFYQDIDGDTYGNTAVSIVACTAPVGYVALNGDCNDNNVAINPGAAEACDGLDNNCNTLVDDNVVILTWYADTDLDGLGNPLVIQLLCSQPVGYVANSNDCDDNNNLIGIASTTFYADSDLDGFGNPSVTIVACTAPVGYVANNSDCNDANNLIGAALTYYLDADGDTYGSASTSQVACSQPVGYVLNNTDCNDAVTAINPGGIEIPDNGIDEDCSGADLVLAGATLGLYQFTSIAVCPVTATQVNTQPTGATFNDFSNAGGTCASTANVFNNSGWTVGAAIDVTKYNEFTVTPDACQALNLTQLIFTHKNSAAGGTSTIIVRSSVDNYISDLGSFTMAAANVLQTETLTLPVGFNALTTATTFRFYVTNMLTTTATYRMDDVTLKGFINALTPTTYYTDADGDGFGDNAAPVLACSVSAGIVSDNTDCNDANIAINPNTIWYQDIDNDGVGSAVMQTACLQPLNYVLTTGDCDDNNNLVTAPTTTYYQDNDADGFGSMISMLACTQPVGYVLNNTDCNDNDNAIGVATTTFYGDVDADGFGDLTNTIIACVAPVGYVTNSTDCNDFNNAIGAPTTFYQDLDNDTYGNLAITQMACSAPVGYVANSTDCNDNNAAVNPGATEIIDNGIDDNCDGASAMAGLSNVEIPMLQLFPNPGKNELTISFLEAINPLLSVEILTADGKLIYSTVLTKTTVINTSELQTGMYVIRLNDQNMHSIVRWVKL